MKVAALITWLLTAVGGFYLLGTWIARGGLRTPGSSRLPKPVLFGHFLFAAAGLVVWIVYLADTKRALAWTAFVLLLPTAVLGLTMFLRWLPSVRGRSTAPATSGGAGTSTSTSTSTDVAERHFPVVLVLGHGVLAVVTVILVLVTAIQNHG